MRSASSPKLSSLLKKLLIAALMGGSVASGQYATPPALDAELQTAQPGDIVNMHGADGYIWLNETPNRQALVIGNLVYSDDPETAEGYGILYRSGVPSGATRLYVYHVNGLAAPAQITAVLENAGDAPALIQFTRKSLRPPSGNYIHIGKNAVRDYYENTVLPPEMTIPAGGTALLDSAMDSLTVSSGQLLSAIYDFTSDEPLTVTTLMLPSGTNTLAANVIATVVPGDGKSRQGTFEEWGKINNQPFEYSTSNNSRMIKIGDGTSYDLYLSGYDHERETATVLKGNFGVTYTFKISVSSPDGKALAVLLNPRGGAHAGYMRATFPDGSAPTGHLLPGLTLTLNDSTKAVVCAMVQPTAAAQTLTLEYMPPGASSLPVNLLLVPYTGTSAVGGWELY